VPELSFFARQINALAVGKRSSVMDVHIRIIAHHIRLRLIEIARSHENTRDTLAEHLRIKGIKTHRLETIFGKAPPLGRFFRAEARCE
jgi:hypothetical protein